MCGIAGLFNLNQRPCQTSDVQGLVEAIIHRGPDGSGIHIDGPVGLGHRRLAILDLSESGKQPLQYGNRYWITYNGEIYNFVELRRELEKLGQHFATNTDTEVVVAAYHHWGGDFVLKLNGMWAFAIWDSHKRELFLSRDRFGVKPLHYLAEPKRFVFGSELKCFLRLKDFKARANQEELRRQLLGGESIEQTLMEGVKSLRPGHNMLVSAAGLRIWRWWCTLDHLATIPGRFADQVEEFRELFFDACRLRLRSDVPIATCLSGGLDSSSILCSLAAMDKTGTSRLTSDYHRAFVATFEGTPHDERAYAEAAIEKAGADARYRPMNSGALIENLPQYAYDFESVGHALLLPVWALYRELRRDGVVVSLDGLGSDELLMGYPNLLRSLLLDNGSLMRAPVRTFDLARTLQRTNPGFESVSRLLARSNALGRTVRSAARRLKSFSAGADSSELLNPLHNEWIKPVTSPNDEVDASEKEAMTSLTPMNQALYAQYHFGVNQSLLRRYDLISMAHGIEVRTPFMDWRLACYAFALPDESKAGGGYTKRVLREAMRGVLPEKVRTRTAKIGFQAPIVSWMNSELGEWAWKRVQTKRFLESTNWDGPAIRDYVAPRHAARNWTNLGASRVWRICQADLWLEAFFGSLSASASSR